MASLNKVQLIGHLGRDPEDRYMPDGAQITNVSLATSHTWKDKTTGEKKEETEWHRVVFRGRLAEVASQYLKKGSLAYVEGRLRTRKWQDKDGGERYSIEILADQMQMLGAKDAARQVPESARTGAAPGPSTAEAPAAAAPAKKKGHFDDMEDDIPF